MFKRRFGSLVWLFLSHAQETHLCQSAVTERRLIDTLHAARNQCPFKTAVWKARSANGFQTIVQYYLLKHRARAKGIPSNELQSAGGTEVCVLQVLTLVECTITDRFNTWWKNKLSYFRTAKTVISQNFQALVESNGNNFIFTERIVGDGSCCAWKHICLIQTPLHDLTHIPIHLRSISNDN